TVGVVLPDVPNPMFYVRDGWDAKISRPTLLANQFLIDQSIQCGLALLDCEISGRPLVEQSLVSDALVPLTLQDDMTIHHGDNAVDNVAAIGDSCQQRNREHEFYKPLGHQNVCPMLK